MIYTCPRCNQELSGSEIDGMLDRVLRHERYCALEFGGEEILFEGGPHDGQRAFVNAAKDLALARSEDTLAIYAVERRGSELVYVHAENQ